MNESDGAPLVCLFCPEAFDDFDDLSTHVATVHREGGETKSQRRRKESQTMPQLPAPSKAAAGGGTFLKSKNLKAKGITTVKLIGIDPTPVRGQYGEQVIASVRIGKTGYTWGINTDSVNYRLLLERFGKNPKRWKGAVKLCVLKSRQGRDYVAIATNKSK